MEENDLTPEQKAVLFGFFDRLRNGELKDNEEALQELKKLAEGVDEEADIKEEAAQA